MNVFPLSRISCLLIALLLTAACTTESGEKASSAESESASSEPQEMSDWQVLFDGQSLDAWRNYRQDTLSHKWQIEDGALTLTEGGGGDIITKDQYESFELELEWKISEAGNSGVFFHVAEADSLPTVYFSGPEVQVLDDERHPDGELPSHRAGSNYDMHPCSEVSVKPVGEWNHLRLVVDNGHVQHVLNEVEVVAYQLGSESWQETLAKSKFADWPMYAKAGQGHIALQDHGDRVWFRNIRIREL